MKKSLLAMAALTAFAGVASAQSSVTLFGVVDNGLRNVKNGNKSLSSMATDGNASSRIGFRGVEDLGGGLRAGFWLEGGVAADVGNIGGGNGSGATAIFNRRATVSLLGNWGEIRLGRDYVPTFWNHTVFDPFGTNGVGSATNLIAIAPTVAPFGNAQTLVRTNNSVGYFLPAIGGLYGQAMYAFGENATYPQKYAGARIGYAAGPVNVAASFGKTFSIAETRNNNAAPNGSFYKDMTAWNVAGSFNAGFLTVYAQYHNYETGNASLAKDKLTLKNYMGGVAIPVGAGTIKVSAAKTKRELPGATATSTVSRSATQFAAGYVYDLSKRTAVYVHASQIDNDTGLAYVAGAGGGVSNNPAQAAGGFKSTGYEIGVRHSF